MVTFGIDISHHQSLSLDLARCEREGISFVFMKATEGSSFVDNEFASNLAEARRAGLLTAAYHYVRANVSAAAQVAHIKRVVPRDVPVILDTEVGSGGVALTREIVRLLRVEGYVVPVSYFPRWYWQQLGSPSLVGLPPLWSSRYPDMVQGSIADEWADVPASYWDGHGGLPVAVLQFTSSARIAGHAPIDANAYRGTAAQLAALLGGEENDMPSLEEMLNTKLGNDGTTAFDAWADKPGTLGHWLRGQRQYVAGTREVVAAQAEAITALSEQIEMAIGEAIAHYLAANPPQVAVDTEAVARAVVAEFKKEGN